MGDRNRGSILRKIRPEEYLFLIFATLLIVLFIAYKGDPNYTRGATGRMLMGFGVVLILGVSTNYRKIRTSWREARRDVYRSIYMTARDWFPFVLCILVYENLHDLVKLVRPELADYTLMWFDKQIFGVQPTIWMQNITFPALTDVMAICYGLYFFFPAIFLVFLYYNKLYGDFRNVALAIIIGFYIGFLGYIAIPAVGPRFILDSSYTVRLEGILFYDTTRDLWNSLETINRDCFPSMHTCTTVITLLFAWKYRKRYKGGRLLFWIFLPLIVGLWMSTVYLRFHWVIDVIVGFLLALDLYLWIPVLNAWWRRRIYRIPDNVPKTSPRGDKR